VNTSGLDFDVANMGVKVNCPECQAPNTVTLGQVQREETVTCAECNKSIKLVDKNKSVDRAVSDINDAVDDLKKALEDLGR
jgi:peptide subunit release factor 1 (eRF1)